MPSSSGSSEISSFEPMVGMICSGESPGTPRRRAYQEAMDSRSCGLPVSSG
jgi:hypothetical protein